MKWEWPRREKILYDFFSVFHVFALLFFLQGADRASTTRVRLDPAATQMERVTRIPITFASLQCKEAPERLQYGK